MHRQRGDVYPFLAISKALQQRGHDVELLTSPHFRERIEAAGVAFVPIGTVEDYDRGIADPRIWQGRRGFAAMWDAMRPLLREGYDKVVDRVRPDTVLVGSTLAWSNRCAQEKLRWPGATVHLAPSLMFSAIDPPIWPGLAWLRHVPTWCVRLAQRVGERFVLDATVAPGINALRAEVGLPAVRRIMSEWQNSPDLVIDAFPDWFAAPQSDWPPRTVTTDFPRWNAAEQVALDAALLAFLDAGPKPIGITPGSAMAHGRPMFERAIAACAALGKRAIAITPYRDQLPDVLPQNVFHAAYAPFDLLLPELGAFVHHGGIGTCAQSLHAGVPQLITPFAHDQFDNAARLRRLGVADSIAPLASATRWKQAIENLAQNADMAAACSHWAQRSREGEPGEILIARQIETLRPH